MCTVLFDKLDLVHNQQGWIIQLYSCRLPVFNTEKRYRLSLTRREKTPPLYWTSWLYINIAYIDVTLPVSEVARSCRVRVRLLSVLLLLSNGGSIIQTCCDFSRILLWEKHKTFRATIRHTHYQTYRDIADTQEITLKVTKLSESEIEND